MKRILTLMVTVGIIFGLVACGGNDEEDSVEPNETEENTATEEIDEEEAPSEDTEEEDKDAEESNSETETEGNSEIADYEESTVIEEEIDVSNLDVEVETDNENNRVILFKDDDKAFYKTVYIKHDQRLKIIDIIDNEGQIYNEIIK